jgi:lipoprotein-anchoring transpeptidase ErfK/SrfK
MAATLLCVAGKTTPEDKAKNEPSDEATHLQIFLDRANFSPGKIDGRYGDFTLKALALYRESQGKAEPVEPKTSKEGVKPNLDGIDLSPVDPIFIDYTVSDEDAQNTGDFPKSIPEQSKLKWLPYRDLAEAVAEKFHCDSDYFAKLNPNAAKLKSGDHVRVPNVPPFELAPLKKAAEKNKGKRERDEDAPPPSPNSDEKKAVIVKVDTKLNMLEVREGDHLVAAYPVTVGSAHTESPIGDWQVREISPLPVFRYDKEMLNHGKRSGDFYNLAPGPNNMVGVMWIALNKKGIGLHGTSEPDTIGRSSSHGCVRLANWDVVRLAERIKLGVAVSIH